MNKHQVKCTCGTCESEGNYFQCKGCLRICPYCFGCSDQWWEYCDDCAHYLSIGVGPQDLITVVSNKEKVIKMENFQSRPSHFQGERTLINIYLPNEPITRKRSYCLRQLSKDQWCTCYYSEDGDEFYHGHYFDNIDDAYVEFRSELNRQMERYEHFVSMFFKYRSYIVSEEHDEASRGLEEEQSESNIDYSKGVNWIDAEADMNDAGITIKLIDGEYCAVSSRDNTIYYTAKTKEDLITYYFNGDMSDYR